MNYEKEYIDFLIEESSKNPKIKPFLEEYLYNKIDFSELVELLNENIFDILSWRNFKKDKDIDKLFE